MYKLLIIDDEIDICNSMKKFFTRRGYEVIYSVTGQGGIDAFCAERPGIVILDLGLPDMFGLEVLKKIKSIDPHCIVIISTASTLDKYKKKAKSLGANYYLFKPYAIQELHKLVETLEGQGR